MGVSLAPLITTTCREFFGRVVLRSGKRQLVDNRCSECPIRSECLAWGGKPARTMEELRENGEVFAREAEAVLG